MSRLAAAEQCSFCGHALHGHPCPGEIQTGTTKQPKPQPCPCNKENHDQTEG